MGMIAASVRPSGVGFRFDLDSYVEGVSDNNETMQFVLTGNTADGTATLPGTYTLSWGGHTTPPIRTVAAPPTTYFQWDYTLPAPGARDLWVNFNQYGGGSTWNQWHEVLDGGVLLGHVVLNHGGDGGWGGGVTNPAYTPDPALVTPSYGPVKWYPLGRWTFGTTGLAVRCSCDGNSPDGHDTMGCDNLKVVTTDGLTSARVGAAMPPAIMGQAPGSQPDTGPKGWQCPDDTANALEVIGSGAGGRFVLDAATVLAALEALPSIGAGNVSVVG